MSAQGHNRSGSVNQNHRAQLINAYNELGKELSSNKVRVVGNYTLGKVIGEGAFGKVRMGTHRLTSTRVAIKQIPKAMSASLTREIHHHRQLHHPHVTQMYEVIATESSIWIVTELCSGGELFDFLAEKGRLPEEEARMFFGQLCLAVSYLHEKGIVHRDLKLENVLLDERCRVKLGDFGFTREYERGTYMETFCGTTGYASPEMLQGKKYMGPEVDVWSLGIILYCLLTGTLPFDDDDEVVMRDMIIQGDFEDPEWLSADARSMIQKILVVDPAKRLTIPQILAHSWFTARPSNQSDLSLFLTRTPSIIQSQAPSPLLVPETLEPDPISAASSATSDSTFQTASSEFATSTPTTPDDHINDDPFESIKVDGDQPMTHHNTSETTLRKTTGQSTKTIQQPETVVEEEMPAEDATPMRPTFQSNSTNSSASKTVPPLHPTRTPARTKRRSVSSNLSDPASPTADKTLTPLPQQDFSSLLNTPAPMIFSTPLERELLNSLSLLGLDTAQIVHSVLSDACDAAGAVWWLLKRKAEKRALEDETMKVLPSPIEKLALLDSRDHHHPSSRGKNASKRAVAIQTETLTPSNALLSIAQFMPEFSLVPATPTGPSAAAGSATTPPRSTSPLGRLSPSMSPLPSGADVARSYPSTPGGSMKDSKGRRDSKNRSGSVSIMQRATTALEAAGLVRKKSSDAVKDQQEGPRDRDRDKAREVEKKAMSGEESRTSHGSGGSSKLTKSPPSSKALRESAVTPSTPSAEDHAQLSMGSPWVMTGSKSSPPPPSPANSPGDTLTSLPNFSGAKVPNRNRASLLSAFRFWFNEDRKGKQKNPTQRISPGNPRNLSHRNTIATPGSVNITPNNKGSIKRGGSGSGGNYHRGHRHSVSSRRSSSVNSRRSSGASAMVADSPHLTDIPNRRSFGAHTPNSERGEFSSRPSSIRSFSMNRHRKSPSQSSAGSIHMRNASPTQKYHRRAGSGSSTRVVRQIQPTRSSHVRSNSATSSIHSRSSSRPTSFYEDSERIGSPIKRALEETTPRRANFGNTTFVAQKRQTPFTSPGNQFTVNSIGRSSWKKAWGLEPPGWQSRATHLSSIEVLSVSPGAESPSGAIRDVFTGRASLTLGDEDDWVDEDDDLPVFASGLGQMPTSASSSSSFGHHINDHAPLTLALPPRGAATGRASSKRTNRNATLAPSNTSSNNSRGKPVHSPGGRTSPVPPESSYDPSDSRGGSGGGRRQLPAGRSGPAPIVEEDEGEEE